MLAFTWPTLPSLHHQVETKLYISTKRRHLLTLPTSTHFTRLARELQAEMRQAGHAAARCGALPSDYASHRGLALASVLHRLHAAGAP